MVAPYKGNTIPPFPEKTENTMAGAAGNCYGMKDNSHNNDILTKVTIFSDVPLYQPIAALATSKFLCAVKVLGWSKPKTRSKTSNAFSQYFNAWE